MATHAIFYFPQPPRFISPINLNIRAEIPEIDSH